MTEIKIIGTPDRLMQWDTGRKLQVSGAEGTWRAHIYTDCLDAALVVAPDEAGTVEIPNIVLTRAWPVTVAIYRQDTPGGESQTVAMTTFRVQPRVIPEDYRYEDNVGYIDWIAKAAEVEAYIAALRSTMDELQRRAQSGEFDGVSVVGVTINAASHLIVTLSNGQIIDAGHVGGGEDLSNLRDRIDTIDGNVAGLRVDLGLRQVAGATVRIADGEILELGGSNGISFESLGTPTAPVLQILGARGDEAVTIRHLATPTQDSDAANKGYVDSVAQKKQGKGDPVHINDGAALVFGQDAGAYVQNATEDREAPVLELLGNDADQPVTLRNIATPSEANDAATKEYVDSRSGGGMGDDQTFLELASQCGLVEPLAPAPGVAFTDASGDVFIL